jgi:hypothetical protein
MRKQRIEQSAMDVAHQVRAVEDSIETALMELAELQGRMLRARSVTGVGISTGHQAFEQLAASLQALVQARGGIANCHAALLDATQEVPGLRATGFGDLSKCPPPGATAQLRAVA